MYDVFMHKNNEECIAQQHKSHVKIQKKMLHMHHFVRWLCCLNNESTTLTAFIVILWVNVLHKCHQCVHDDINNDAQWQKYKIKCECGTHHICSCAIECTKALFSLR